MDDPFLPKLVYFEPKALDYPLGKELMEKFEKMDIEVRYTTSHNQVRDLPGENDLQKYRIAKSTLVVGIRKTLKFDTSKPSAEYAIPLATGCMGHCHYCYLQTTIIKYISNSKRQKNKCHCLPTVTLTLLAYTKNNPYIHYIQPIRIVKKFC